MAAVEITFESAAAEAALKRYPARTTRAMVRALNRALTTGRAEGARLVSKDMGLKVSDAKDALVPTEATSSKLEIRLAASKKRRPLIEFKAKDQRPRGVTYRVGARGSSRLPNAFITTVRRAGQAGTHSGHDGVFLRQGKKRLPIRQLYGPSLGGVFAKYREQVSKKMREAFDTRLAHELKFAATEK